MSDLSADGKELLPGSSDTDELSIPELSTLELDLETCQSVKFKMQEDTPGVGYILSLHEEMKDRCLLALADPGEVPNSDSIDQDHFYTTIRSARDVTSRIGRVPLVSRSGKAVLHPVCPGSQLSPLLLLHGLELGLELSCQ